MLVHPYEYLSGLIGDGDERVLPLEGNRWLVLQRTTLFFSEGAPAIQVAIFEEEGEALERYIINTEDELDSFGFDQHRIVSGQLSVSIRMFQVDGPVPFEAQKETVDHLRAHTVQDFVHRAVVT